VHKRFVYFPIHSPSSTQIVNFSKKNRKKLLLLFPPSIQQIIPNKMHFGPLENHLARKAGKVSKIKA
jgi:hypothetical protein